jgi:hypothetical protein
VYHGTWPFLTNHKVYFVPDNLTYMYHAADPFQPIIRFIISLDPVPPRTMSFPICPKRSKGIYLYIYIYILQASANRRRHFHYSQSQH